MLFGAMVKSESLCEFVVKIKKFSNSEVKTFDISSTAGLLLVCLNSAFFKRR